MQERTTNWTEPAGVANDCGATSVEYGLIVTFVAAVMMFILFVLGPEIVELFRSGCHMTVC